jgi:hypothetical protein
MKIWSIELHKDSGKWIPIHESVSSISCIDWTVSIAAFVNFEHAVSFCNKLNNLTD